MLRLKQENIRLRQEAYSVLKLLLQWKRDGDKTGWSLVALTVENSKPTGIYGIL